MRSKWLEPASMTFECEVTEVQAGICGVCGLKRLAWTSEVGVEAI